MRKGRLGRHLLVDFYDCDNSILDDVTDLEKRLVESAVQANSTVIKSVFHHYSPYGVSGVVVIAESDITIHTWNGLPVRDMSTFLRNESRLDERA
jgi:S-adenosylmethionine decarboxylase proenzyme